ASAPSPPAVCFDSSICVATSRQYPATHQRSTPSSSAIAKRLPSQPPSSTPGAIHATVGHSTLPRRACARAEDAAVSTMLASELASAACIAASAGTPCSGSSQASAATSTSPPPIPSSPAITPAQAPSNRNTSSADSAHPVRKRRAWMLGYSPAMHKYAPFTAALACGMSLLAGTARAQQAAPPLKNPAPVRVAMPGDALRSAFEAADRGNLDELALAGFASQPLAGWLEYAALRRHFDELPIAR